MAQEIRIITVFGSGHPRSSDPDYEEARRLGGELARRGFAVCTGGYGGVMEAALRGAREAGGRSIGVTTKAFRGAANAFVGEERSADSWQARLFELIRAADGYVACKGGTGTLAELAVVWEMLNKRVIEHKPLVVLGEFWAPVIARVIEGERDRAPLRADAARRPIQIAHDASEAAEWVSRAVEAAAAGGMHATSF